ncbi:hypothetical protein UFOVP849_3 [uncultured Caudovirales phage]|uniref:Uncharacterized protein n=1 Tax=uncultured Caudovirales phage TaxID=2100421 RepID=A0A6J5P925_9CAUD|nr:hypothetical protein UFOVP849_3 [uncultured Caudovirales phage]
MAFDPDQFVSGVRPAPEEPKKKSSGFDPDAYINSGVSQAPTAAELDTELSTSGTDLAGMVTAPAVTGAAFAQPTGINPQAVRQGLAPMIEAVPKTLGVYSNKPIAGIADVAAVAMGLPPPVASFQGGKGIMALPGAVSATASEIGKITSQSPMATSPVSGNQYPSSVPDYRAIQRSVGPEAAQRMSEAYAKGGNNAVLKYLDSAPEVRALMGNEDFARLYETYRGAVPSKMTQVGKVVGPAVRGAARVLGPAGLAYDAYQAQQFAEQSELGPRLAQGEGAIAPQAFRNMNVPYGQGFTGSMTPDQASAVLESGSARDIEAFGGQDYLTQLIRKKAAERVLGPIAP